MNIPIKAILTPLDAGIALLERYNLFCEARFAWDDPRLAECAERVLSAHAPYEATLEGGRKVRLNIASPDEEFRRFSVGRLETFVRAAQDAAPNCRTIVSHSAPRFWDEDAGRPCEIREVGQYGRLIESLQRLSRVAGECGLRFVIENNRVRWDAFGDVEQYERDKHHGRVLEYFALSPHDWSGLPDDVGEPAFGLCLDTSHAATYAHRFPSEGRAGVVGLFVALGAGQIRHCHWTDGELVSTRGRADLHLGLGKGDLPRGAHRDVWELPGCRAWLLERWEGEGGVASDLRFIERL